MRRSLLLWFTLPLLAVVGCETANPRIGEHAAEFAALDASTQHDIKRGIVQLGYTADMAYMALGHPTQTATDAAGDIIWTYAQYPVTPYNETMQAGFRRRVVFDPVKRTSDVVVEPIDTKAFPNLVPHSLRLTFRAGHVIAIERINHA